MPKKLSNKPTRALNAEQNETVFKLLQPDCKTLVTTVATLYYYYNGKWLKQFSGVLCFERDTKKKAYYLRFYRNCFTAPEMVLQEKVKTRGLKFSIPRDQLFQMKIGCKWIGFQFLFTHEGFEEFTELAMALRGNMRKLKKEAEARYYEEHPEQQKESRFRRLFRWKHRSKRMKEKKSSPKVDFRHAQSGSDSKTGTAIQDWINDPVVRQLLEQMGLEYDDVVRSPECRKKLENMIRSRGGLEEFRKSARRKGFATQVVVNPTAEQYYDRGSKILPVDSPMSMGMLKESWMKVLDDDDYMAPNPTAPSTSTTQLTTKASTTQPNQSASVKTTRFEESEQEQELREYDDYIRYLPEPIHGIWDERWLKVLEDMNLEVFEDPEEKKNPPLKPQQPKELLDEIIAFNPKKLRSVPVTNLSSLPPKTTPDADDTKAAEAEKASVDAPTTLEEELNKTAQEIQALREAEKQRAKQERKAQKTKKAQEDKLKSPTESAETTSDSDSDDSDDEVTPK